MADPPPSRDSKRHHTRELARKGKHWLKDTFRVGSDSHPSSPRLGRSPVPPATSRDSSPVPSNNPSRPATTEEAFSHPIPEATGRFGPPSVVGSNPAEPNTGAGSNPGSSARGKLKEAGDVAWAGLGTALEVFVKSADVFPPLKSAISELNGCLEIVKVAAENYEGYNNLVSELKSMVEAFSQHASEIGAEDPDGSMATITSSIKNEVERIKKKQDRGNVERILASAQDRDDVLQCYRSIKASFRQLQTKVGLRTLRNTNEQVDISKDLRRDLNEQLDISRDLIRRRNEEHEMALIQSMSPEEDARYNSAYSMTVKRGGCTVETREKVQEGLREWVRNQNSAKVYWMNGMAGTGKTTIAYSLCKWLEENNLLGASFFCSRTSASCRDVNRIVPTVSCQLARYSPAFRSALYNQLRGDPGVSRLNVVDQFEKLVKAPLLEIEEVIPNGVVVVIDALDECEDNCGVRLVLATLMRFAANLPLKFFVSSRPEPVIQDKMLSSNDYSPFVLRLHDIESSIVEEDIKKYLKEELSYISPPPSDEQVELLARRAGKLFIYAATVVRYILPDNASANSSIRLKAMLAITSQSTNNAGSGKKYKDLDALYSTILTTAFDKTLEDEETEAIRLVLWTAVCAKEPMTAETLALLLDLDEQQVWTALRPLQSVLHISESRLVSPLHASFPDYVLDRSRSGKFCCDEARHSQVLAGRCFDVMKEQLRFNICSLESSSVFDKHVLDLEERIKTSITPALSYACQYWGEHLRPADPSDVLCDRLADFLAHKLLFWMEVLNLQRRIVMGAAILLETQNWLLAKSSPADLKQKVLDAENFVSRFTASGCICSTPHIYVSALPLCPKSSSVYMNYWGRTRGLLDVRGTAINSQGRAAIAAWMAGSGINAVSCSPDGTRIVSGSDDDIVQVWDMHTGDLVVGPFKGHTALVFSVAFSPDGARIVSSSSDHTIRVWDARTGDLIAGPFEGHTSSVWSVAFSPDGSHIVSGSGDHTIRVWDGRTGDLVAGPFEGHTDLVYSVAFSPDGTRLASGSRDSTIRVWDALTGDLVAGPFKGHTDKVNSVAFSPDGTRIVSGSGDSTIRVWDAHTGDLVAGPFEGHTSSVNSVAFSHDGARVVSGSGDSTIRVWDVCTGDFVSGPFEGHTSSVWSVAFSPDGTHVVSGSWDHTIRVWDVRTTDLVAEPLGGHTSSVNSVAFSPDGTCIVSGSWDCTIRVWDARTGELVTGPFKGHTDFVYSVAFSPDGTRIVSGSVDYTIRVWDAHTGDLVAGPFKGHTDEVYSVAFSPDGTRIVSGSRDSTIRIWDGRTGNLVAGPFEGHTSSVWSVAFSPDGTHVVSGSWDHTIRVWDVRTGDLIARPFKGHSDLVYSVAFSPDGTRIVSGSGDYTIRVWNAHTGSLFAGPFKGHTDEVYSVAFSPDGTHIVSGSRDSTIRVWDARTGDLVAEPFEGHTSLVPSVAFSPDGTRIVSGSWDHTIRVWDVCIAGPSHTPAHANHFVAPTSGQMNSPDPCYPSLVSSHNNWQLGEDGWITVGGASLFCLPLDILQCMPRPQNVFVIARRGSLWVENWNLLVGESWSKCYLSQ